MDVLKYESTNANELTILPVIATGLNPYLFAKAETKGPVIKKIKNF